MTCTTHHHACKCREAEFARVEAERDRLRAENAELERVLAAATRIAREQALGHIPYPQDVIYLTATDEQKVRAREAANRIAELEAERDHYREALEVAYWAYANLERDRDTLTETANRITELEAERDRYREALERLSESDMGEAARFVARAALSEQEGEG